MTNTEAIAHVLNEQYLPAFRSMIAAAVQTAKLCSVTADVHARLGRLMCDGGQPIQSAHATYAPWRELLVGMCRAGVKNGLIDRNDPIFDGFDF